MGSGAYYDLTVPGAHHYLANGLWHHNSGKTRSASEWLHQRAREGRMREGVLIGPTAADLRDVMVQGPSGLLHTGRRHVRYEPSKRLLTWPNGAIAHTRSAEEPDSIRGLNVDTAWLDESGVYRFGVEVRDNLVLALRVGEHPRALWTTTPRSMPLVKAEIKEAERQEGAIAAEGGYTITDLVHGQIAEVWRRAPTVVVTRMSTYDNLRNLSPSFAREVVTRYEGTRLGQQELHAVLLGDLGVMFQRAWFIDRMLDAPWPRARAITWVRRWDLASVEPNDRNPDPDYTVGVLLGRDSSTSPPRYCWADVRRLQATPGTVQAEVLTTANLDGPDVRVVIAKDPGQAGVDQIENYRRALQGIAPFSHQPETGPKLTRAEGVATAAEAGRIHVVRAPWNDIAFGELEDFDGTTGQGRHDDIVDALAGAFNWLENRGGPAHVESVADTRIGTSRQEMPGVLPPGVPRGVLTRRLPLR